MLLNVGLVCYAPKPDDTIGQTCSYMEPGTVQGTDTLPNTGTTGQCSCEIVKGKVG